MSEEEGRALDAQVAERLFGWTNIHQDHDGDWIGSPAEYPPPGYRIDDYSTDPAAAAEVRREMERLGWRWMMDGPAPHHVMFFRDGSRDAAGKGETEAEATVRGALAALGESD
jgi:hypothetical protein